MSEPSNQSGEAWRPGRPPRTIGPYVVERELGAGRMGTVFLARHPEFDARYAIKVLAADLLDAKDVLRFQREVELLAAAPRHPGLVRVHAAGQERGRSYFVMEFVEGETLQQVVARRERDPRDAARWCRDLAGALAALHGVGIIHRDIKPANILVDPQGRARLADFGLARQLGESASRLTRTGEVMGTPQYMAPEQALGLDVGPPTDVYALGMVLYTLLAGAPAVSGSGMLDILQKVSAGELRPLEEAAPDAPPELVEAVELALSMDPARRPTAAALAARLDAWLAAGRAAPRRSRALAPLVLLAAAAVAAAAAAPLLRPRPADPARDPAAAADARALAARLCDEGLTPDQAAQLSSQAEALADGEGLVLAGEAALRAGGLERARALLARARGGADPREARVLELGLLALSAATTTAEADRGAALALDAVQRRPGRADVRAWAYLVAARASVASAARVVGGVAPDGVPRAARAGALLAAGRLGEAAAVASGAAPGELGPALRSRLAWSLAGRALAADEDGMTARSVDALERAVEGLEALGPLASEPAPEQATAVAAVQRLLTVPWRGPLEPPDVGLLIRRHLGLHTLWRLAEPGHRARPAPELPAEKLMFILDRITVHIRGHGGRRRMARAIALAPDDLNAYVLAYDLAVKHPDAPPEPEPPDFERDLAWLDRALELAGRDAPESLPSLMRDRSAYLSRSGDVERLAAWCEEVARRFPSDAELRRTSLERLGEAHARRGDGAGALAAFRRAADAAPGDLNVRARASGTAMALALRPEGTEAEQRRALEEAEALLADPRFSGPFVRLKHAEGAVELLLRLGGAERARRGLVLLDQAMPGWTMDQASASLLRLRCLLVGCPDVTDATVRARWAEAVEDLAARLDGDAAYQETNAPTFPAPNRAWSERRARELREHIELTIPELRALLARGEVHPLVGHAHSIGGPRPAPPR